MTNFRFMVFEGSLFSACTKTVEFYDFVDF